MNGPAFTDRSMQVGNNKNRPLWLDIGWLRPLGRGDRLLEEKIAVFEGKEIRVFDNWPLNTGWPLNIGSNVSQLSYKVE